MQETDPHINLFRGLVGIYPTVYFGKLCAFLLATGANPLIIAIYSLVFVYFSYVFLSGFAWFVNDCFDTGATKELTEAERIWVTQMKKK